MMKVRYWFLILCLFGLCYGLPHRDEIAPNYDYYRFENGNDVFWDKENRGSIIHRIWKLQMAYP